MQLNPLQTDKVLNFLTAKGIGVACTTCGDGFTNPASGSNVAKAPSYIMDFNSLPISAPGGGVTANSNYVVVSVTCPSCYTVRLFDSQILQ